jgi:hypothetical protein
MHQFQRLRIHFSPHSGALGSTFTCSRIMYSAGLFVNESVRDQRRQAPLRDRHRRERSELHRVGAIFGPFGTAQQSRFDNLSGAAILPLQTLAITNSLSVSICGGTVPASHHFTTSALILS